MGILTNSWKWIALSLGLACVALAGGPEFDRAQRLYGVTDFDGSLKVLQSMPAKDASVLALIGQNYYMLTDYKKATEFLERSVANNPANSQYALWLARAYGRRAETSSVLTAPGHASKAHRYFEKAVEIDPKNLEAVNDLFEYYLEAPGFLGGGFDKAQALAGRIAQLNPAEGYWAQAKLDEKRKEYGAAEMDLRRAAAAAPRQIGKLIELAKLLARHGHYQEADQAIDAAEQIAPDSPRLLFAKADLYIKTGRHLDVARKLLERYLASSLTPDDPPRADAQKLLRQTSGPSGL
jgi:tetratricopeptide (TPR) repeat protein